MDLSYYIEGRMLLHTIHGLFQLTLCLGVGAKIVTHCAGKGWLNSPMKIEQALSKLVSFHLKLMATSNNSPS